MVEDVAELVAELDVPALRVGVRLLVEQVRALEPPEREQPCRPSASDEVRDGPWPPQIVFAVK